MKDKEGNVHPVRLAFKKMGKTRDERPLHRTELLTRLNKGDLTVAKAGHLRKAVRTGDTELAHALMPKSVNKQRYQAAIHKAQKKLTKKVHESFVSFGEYIAETTTKKHKAHAIGQRIDHILRAQHHIAKNLGKGIDIEDQEPQAKISHKSFEMARDSINRKLRKAIREDIDLIPADRFDDEERKFYGKSKNLGEFHPGYDLHQRSYRTHPVKHIFSMVHKASGNVAGEMHAYGGKLHPIKGVVLGTKGKGLKVSHLSVHANHREKKVGKSLAVEMYRHLHRRGHAIQSDTIQSHGAAHVWNTMRNDPELKKHMMIHDQGKPVPGEVSRLEKRAHRKTENYIWHQSAGEHVYGKEKVRGSRGLEPESVKTLVLSGKKQKKKKVVKEDIEMTNALGKPHGGYYRDFAAMVAGRGIKPKRSGRIAKGYTLHTSKDKDNPKIENHHIVHDATGHVAGEITTANTHENHHTVIHTDIHGDHTQKKIGKSLAVLAYKHLARKKKGNLWSSTLQTPGGASVWNRIRKDPKMKGRVFHSSTSGEVPAHDVPDKKIWASATKIERSKNTPEHLGASEKPRKEHETALRSRLVIRHPKKT
jgi:ribosomal protein S18 acetylase RimI-like enzyme